MFNSFKKKKLSGLKGTGRQSSKLAWATQRNPVSKNKTAKLAVLYSHTPLIPVLWIQRQVDICEFEGSQAFIVRSCLRKTLIIV